MCNSQTHTPWGGLTLRSQSVFIKTSPKPNPHLGKDLGAPTSTSHRQRQGRGPRSLDTEREQSGGRLRQGRRVLPSLPVTSANPSLWPESPPSSLPPLRALVSAPPRPRAPPQTSVTQRLCAATPRSRHDFSPGGRSRASLAVRTATREE